jgi:perosamine synthetase
MIPVFEPEIGQEEIDAVVDALKKGEISGSFGKYIPAFENAFAAYVDCKHGIAVTSGTTALHLAVSALELPVGSEVLVSTSTNIASVLGIVHNNLVPVPVDSEEETWNINPELLEPLITPKTRALLVVHLFGHPCEMDKIVSLCRKHRLALIEDCAESHGATYNGKMTGSFGEMGCFSFYANKIITTGEGGMVTTNDPKLAEKLRLLRNLAFTTPRFWHPVAAYQFRMTGYQAAMGLVQTKKIEQIIAAKRRVAHAYADHLRTVSELQLPCEKSYARNVYWMYGVLLKDGHRFNRKLLTEALRKRGVDTRTFFCPMNQQPFVQQVKGYRGTSCPVADNLWENGFYLPSSTSLSDGDIKFVAESIQKSLKEITSLK